MEKLYNALSEQGKYTKSFEDFQTQFGSKEGQEKLYEALESSGDYTKSFEDFSGQFFSGEPAKTNDSASADPAVESNQNSTGSKSVNGFSESRDASDFANTQEQDTAFERQFGKNEFTDFFGDLYRSWDAGTEAGSSVNEAFDVYKGKDATDEEIYSFLDKTRSIEEKGQTDEMIAASEKMALLKEEGYNGVSAFFAGWWENPSAMLQYSVMSLSQMGRALFDSEEVAGAALASAGAGAGTGALAGLAGGPFTPITSTAGAIAGTVGGFFGGLSGSMETGMTTAALIQESAVEDGLDWGNLSDKERFDYVRKVQNNTDKFNDIKSKAVARGIAIGAIDGLVGAIAPGVGNAAFKSAAKGTKSALAQVARVGSTAALETAGGMASEVAGQAAAGQEFNLEEILIEGFADKTFTGVSLLKATAQGAPKYSINGEKMNGKQFIDNIKSLDDEAFVVTDAIKAENSPAVNKLISDRRQNISADQKVDSRISKVEDRTAVINLIKEQKKLEGNPKGNKTKLTQIQAKIDTITETYANSEVDATIEQRKQAIASAVDTKFEAEFNKNFKALDDAKDVTGQEPVLFESDNAYLDAVEKVFGPEGRVEAAKTDGVFAGEGKVFINKAQAKASIDIATGNNGAISVTSHEVLHPIFSALIGGAKTQGSFVKQFRTRMTGEQKTYVDKEIKRRYGKDAKSVTGTELMNVFSDGILKNELTYDQTFFEKAGSYILRLFDKQGFDKLSFDNGKDVYNFLKEYNTSIKEGKLSDKAIDTIKKAEAKEGVKVADAKLLSKKQFSKSVAEAEAALDAAMDADPDNPSYLDNIDKAEAELDVAEAAAKAPPAVVSEAKKDPKKDIEVFHGGNVKDIKGIDGVVYFSEDKAQANQYAEGNNGEVRGFKLNEADITTEARIFEVIRELGIQPRVKGWTIDDSRLYELIDDRFDNAFTKEDLSKLNEALAEKGIKAARFTDTNLITGKDTENIVVFDKSAINQKAKPKPKVVRPKEPTRTTDLGPRDPLSQKIMDTYDEGMEGAERTEYKASKPLPSRLERLLVPMFEGYINTIVQQKFKQFANEALEFQDALSILRAEVSNAIRTYNPAKNKDLAGYVKKIIQTRQSLMFKDANAEFAATLDDAKGVTATEDTQSIDRSGTVERGQATFDELDIVDDVLIEDIKNDLEKEIRVRVQKGTLSEMISVKKGRETYLVSWLENYVNKQLFKKLSKKLGAIAGVYPNAVIPGSYIDFLNDPKTFDIITKALPIKSIKKSYSKLFPVERVGREVTAEGNPVFKISKIKPKEFLTYFVKGNKSTVLERQKQLFREILEPLAKQVVADYATPDNLIELKSIQELAPEQSADVIEKISIETQINKLQSQLDRYKGENTGFDVIQFSKTINELDISKKDTTKYFNLLIQGGIYSETAKEFLLKRGVSEENYEAIAGDLISEGIIAQMQEIKAVNKGIKYEKALKNVLNKYTEAGLKVNFISKRKGDLEISFGKNSYKIEVKLNNKAQIGSASAGPFIQKDGKITLRTNLKLSKKISDFNFNKFTNFINSKETKKYLNDLLKAINKANSKSNDKATISRSGHIKLPSKDFWDNIKREMPNKQGGYVSFEGDQSIVEDFYKDIDLIQIGDQGAYAIGNDSKLTNFYEKLSAVIDNVYRPVRTGTTVYMRLFPNFKEIKNSKQDSLDTKQGISKLSKTIISFSKSNSEDVKKAKTISKEFNDIIQGATGIDTNKIVSEAKGKILGKKKGRFRFFLPPSAEDFAGLLYKLLGKNKEGDTQQAWFKKNLFDPFGIAMREFESYKQNVTGIVNQLKKEIKKVPSALKKTNSTGFTNEVAVRVYLWAKNGYDIKGLTETDKKELIDIVEGDSDLIAFATQMDTVLNGYPEPQNDWLAGTITTDAINMINTTKRAEFLQEWQANADAIFTEDNLNKLRAAFGENYVEAMKDMLYRMKSGRNRPSGANKLTNNFNNWVNDSVGTIMFFNTRSALLQTLSIVNFINWGDNNPIQAAKAFANQKQFWSDFSMLFNSDFLKQRRSGLKNDVNADDIANAAETATNKSKAVFASILKMGFLPTQMADSFAIAMGGASFVRNRISKYVSEGMDKKAAEEKALLDFQEIAEETQQSSRPDRISQQQASPLGRIVLAFANTPMQYMRLTKKAFLDLKNGRGDAKTNITKIIYYSVVQNIIFSALQSALFAAAFQDDDEEAIKDRELRIANSMLDSILRGAGVYGAVASTLKNIVVEVGNQASKDRPDFTVAAQRSLSISPPIDSKMRKIMGAARAFSYKTTRDKMKGFGLDNPAYYATGQVVSAAFNLPLDRVIRKADNLRVAVDNDTKYWQSIALMLGYSQWDLGLIQSEKKKKKSGFGKTTKWTKGEWKK